MKASCLWCGRGKEARGHSSMYSTFQASTWRMEVNDFHTLRVWLSPWDSLHIHLSSHRLSHLRFLLQFSWFHLFLRSRITTHFLPSFLPLLSLPLLHHQPLILVAPSRQSGSHSLLSDLLDDLFVTGYENHLRLLRKCHALRFLEHSCASIWLPAHLSRFSLQLNFRSTFKIAE